MQHRSTSFCLVGLALRLAFASIPVSAQSVEDETTIGFTTGKVEEIMPETISGFALAAERGHLKVPINKDAVQ